MVFRWRAVLAVCVALVGGVPDALAGEWLNFYPAAGELSLGFDGRWNESGSGNSSWRTKYEERLRLQLGGYGLDPRIFTFNADLEPALSQERSDSQTGVAETNNTDSTFLNYRTRFSLLHGMQASPISLSADFSANTGETDGSLGNRSDFTTESRGASLQWKFRPFRSSIDYRERSLEEIFIPGFGQPPTERNEFQRTLTYRGRSRGMELLLEGIEFDDELKPDQSYEARKGRLNNNFNWGKRSSLQSMLEYTDRVGFQAEEKTTVNELLRLQHTQNLSTAYNYTYNSSHRTIDTENQGGNFELRHQLYDNLVTSLKIGATNTESSDLFREKTRDANLDFTYNKQIRPDIRVTANLGGGYRTTDRTGGLFDYTESAVVPASGIITLVQRYIVWSTIVVTAPGCSPCQQGLHYNVVDAGGDFTQINVPLGSPININDPIAVDYIFEPPTVEYYGIPYRVGIRLEYGDFAFYHRTSGEDQTFQSGPDPDAVGDRRTDTTGIEWNRTRGRSRTTASIERNYTETLDQSTTEYLLRQSLDYTIAPNATMRVAFGETFFRDGAAANTYNGDLSVKWLAAPGLSVAPSLSGFRRTANPGGTASFIKAGVDVTWKWRRLAMDMRYDHTQHDNNGSTRIEDRVFVKLKRKF